MSDAVISAMLKTEGPRDDARDVYPYPYPYWGPYPYLAYVGPYSPYNYRPWCPRVGVRMDFRFGGRWHGRR